MLISACARPRALIVDDDPAVLALIRHGLEDAGVEVLSAGDGASGLRLLVENLLDLDLLVTDLNMPGIDGTSLVRIVRAEGGERELAIMVLASTISGRDRELLGRLGVDALVEKAAGAEHVVRRAVALARDGSSRRLDAADDTTPPMGVPLARIAPVRRAR